eukprot:TRINITY_DN2683_c0_g1_i1.p1 TRINITY_DN2683_c0_g1~~TRINITY_DN2683_c0_g1_i1.p1  ORF type:complete len:567 (+),score=96.91 TRINITY_DN2683_c0_g1_i1:606-2306(+)
MAFNFTAHSEFGEIGVKKADGGILGSFKVDEDDDDDDDDDGPNDGSDVVDDDGGQDAQDESRTPSPLPEHESTAVSSEHAPAISVLPLIHSSSLSSSSSSVESPSPLSALSSLLPPLSPSPPPASPFATEASSPPPQTQDLPPSSLSSSSSVVSGPDFADLIPCDKIVINVNEVARGSFGAIYQGMYSGVTVALKEMHCADDDALIREAEILKQMRHKFIISYIGLYRGYNLNLFLVMDFIKGDSLGQYLKHQSLTKDNALYTPLTMLEIVQISRDVAAGMTYLQNNQVLHRDLAARNILISEKKRRVSGTRKWQVKIIDFGMGKFQDPDRTHYSAKNSTSIAVRWSAIETLTSLHFTVKSDVWSYGILLWEMLHPGELPYAKVLHNKIKDLLINGYRLAITKPEVPHQLTEIISSCWLEDPHDRPLFSTILCKMQQLYLSLKAEWRASEQKMGLAPSSLMASSTASSTSSSATLPSTSTTTTTMSPPSSPPTPPSVSSWSTTNVSEWSSSLGLSRDYSNLFKEQNIVGKVLLFLKTNDDWHRLGINVFGDVFLLCDGVRSLQATK